MTSASTRTSSTKPWQPTAAKAALIAVAVIALAFAVQSRRSPDVVVARTEDLGHVHDLVLGSDGALLIASHSGLYRVEDDERATLVGSARHDLMALATNGEGELLASGHPDLRDPDWRVEDKPPFMGLARSDNEGESWRPGELLGDADFHAIAPLDDTSLLAAESSGVVWFNSGEAWDSRSELLLEDLAVSPRDQQVVVGLTDQAVLVMSSDQGRTWTEPEAAPALSALDWSPSGELVGVQPDGAVVSSQTPLQDWSIIGSVTGEPDAILASEGHVWVAVAGGKIWHREDGGPLSLLYSPSDS